MALRVGLMVVALMAAALGAGCGNRGGGGDGTSAFTDAGPRRDGAPAEEDAGPGGGRDTGPGGERDTGPSGGRDAGPPPPGQCDPTCLMFPGSICCTECGCGGMSGSCTPVCPEPYLWDCEIGCCFNYDTGTCMPR